MSSPTRLWYSGLAAVLGFASASVLLAEEATRLDIRWSPVVDLHFQARVAASSKTPSAELAPLAGAVRKVNEPLGGDLLSWGIVEGALYGCSTAADVRAAFADFPERFNLRSPRGNAGDAGREIELRKLGAELADALAQVEPGYLTAIAPLDEQIVGRASTVLAERLGPKEAVCLRYMTEHLGPEDPKAVIPVYLVADMPAPGAVTQLRPGRVGGVCFVAVRDVEPLQLVETVLHEATHALDVVWKETAVLDRLRSKLRAAAAALRPGDLRDVPHTLMFVHAGETVRRNIDPSHRHYGDVSGYYAKLSRATQAVRGPWIDYLDGKIPRDQALDRIVAALGSDTASP